jgi:prevent-host-death family protein
MPVTIPQRELRNQAGAVLRRAEQGERFTITVDGRPVAELGPLPGARTPAGPDRLAAIIAETRVDDHWADELRQMREADTHAAKDPQAA